jgi:hypothetical protein
VLSKEAILIGETKFGELYEIRALLTGPTGTALRIRSIWMKQRLSGVTNLLPWFRIERGDMRFELYTDVALTRDMPELGLRRGDLVKVVDHHVAPDGEEGYSIEVFNAVGETIAVTTVPVGGLEFLREDEVLSVRTLARAG